MTRKNDTSGNSFVATEVAKQLKKYLDVQRRELSFDLTDPYIVGDFVTKPFHKVQRNNFFRRDNTFHQVTKDDVLRHEICVMNSSSELSELELKTKRKLEKQMVQHTNRHVVSPYANAVCVRSNSRSSLEIESEKLQKKRVMSAKRMGRRHVVTRHTPPQRITNSERERIVQLTTRLLVATEKIALPQNRKQTQECQTFPADQYTSFPDVARVRKMRPKSAYSDSGNTVFCSPKNCNRTRSASCRQDVLSSNPLHIKRFNNNFVSTRSLSSPCISRNKSLRSLHLNHEDEESLEGHPTSSTDSTPGYSSQWSINSHGACKSDISTQTLQSQGTQTKKQINVEIESCYSTDSLQSPKRFQRRANHFLNSGEMSTQTKRNEIGSKVLTYEVYVVTGNKLAAGTNANVKINIFGDHGNTGDRLLLKSKTSRTPFQRKQVDVFHLDSKYLGDLESIRIGHDCCTSSGGWFLDKVFIKEGNRSTRAFSFYCRRWLSAKEDDGQIVRDVMLKKITSVSELPQLKNSTSLEVPQALSESYSLSSNSESEIEKLKLEKEKRRNRRISKDNKGRSISKPISSLTGSVNVLSARKQIPSTKSPIPLRGSVRDSISSDSSRNSITMSPRLRRLTPIPNSPSSPGLPHRVSKLPSLVQKNDTKITEEEKVSSLSSSSSSSETSDHEEDDLESKKMKDVSIDDEDKVEFSNKDTMKKYSVNHSDDVYMAGFTAGINATKTKEEEERKLAQKKEEFEEQLRNGSTIHEACEVGDLVRVKELIALIPDLTSKVDERGWSPIHISSAFGHLDLVKWFSVSGVLLTQETPTGYTAIHLAAMNGHVNCIMILSAMGCPISSRTVDNHTPLHLAAMSGHIECVKWLLSNRAKIDVKDSADRTPFDLAVEYQHTECVQLLRMLKRELKRKDSAMAMLRDPTALRKVSVEQRGLGVAPSIGGDSGVGGESNEEEWLSDTEETSDVKGRGGDTRSDELRKTSVVEGRKTSVNRKSSVARRSGVVNNGRKISKQEERQNEQLQDKRKLYEAQRQKLERKRSSFLDSIRQEIDSGEDQNNF